MAFVVSLVVLMGALALGAAVVGLLFSALAELVQELVIPLMPAERKRRRAIAEHEAWEKANPELARRAEEYWSGDWV